VLKIEATDDVLEAVGKAIRTARFHRDELTQAELAEKAGISVSYLSQIENGQREPSTDSLENIASALGCQTSDLFADALKRHPGDARLAAMYEVAKLMEKLAKKEVTVLSFNRKPVKNKTMSG
jgi:transcriptional regulator with XRE-family HTH domain